MKDYWLAKLIAAAGGVDSRKRLQKTVYLLQLAGCPLECDYLLHYYGPYSFELAGLVDQLHGAAIIDETREPLSSGALRYRSAVTERGKAALETFENTAKGHQLLGQIEPFLDKFKELGAKDLWTLELAATVAFYHAGNWREAKEKTAGFKKVAPDDRRLDEAVKLARRFKKSA